MGPNQNQKPVNTGSNAEKNLARKHPRGAKTSSRRPSTPACWGGHTRAGTRSLRRRASRADRVGQRRQLADLPHAAFADHRHHVLVPARSTVEREPAAALDTQRHHTTGEGFAAGWTRTVPAPAGKHRCAALARALGRSRQIFLAARAWPASGRGTPWTIHRPRAHSGTP